jgi:hypothetical protein
MPSSKIGLRPWAVCAVADRTCLLSTRESCSVAGHVGKRIRNDCLAGHDIPCIVACPAPSRLGLNLNLTALLVLMQSFAYLLISANTSCRHPLFQSKDWIPIENLACCPSAMKR